MDPNETIAEEANVITDVDALSVKENYDINGMFKDINLDGLKDGE